MSKSINIVIVLKCCSQINSFCSQINSGHQALDSLRLVRKANWKNLDKSDLGLPFLPRH